MSENFTFQQYQQALTDGRLTAMACEKCGTYTTPPQAVCRNCGGTDVKVAEIVKKGTIRTFTVIRVGPDGTKPPYIVALVETQDGPWVMGNLLVSEPDKNGPEIIGKEVEISSQVVEGDIYAIGKMNALTFTLV